jgi:low molecular weight protein-tyrosine phosphatase
VADTVLIVCHANTARSVMAQLLLERMLATRGITDVRVRSGGVANFARDGMIPSLDARLALRDEGIHLAEDALTSTAIALHPELVAAAQVILTMTREQKAIVEAFAPAAGKPVLTLRELAGESGDIADPAMQGEDVFRACRDEIKRCLEKAFDRLLLLLPDGRG